MKYVIAVCTFNRNDELADCLNSLAKMNFTKEDEFACLVVDNNPNLDAKDLVAKYCDSFPIKLIYKHQPIRGIASARNLALDVAVEGGFDFLAFIDDDETADIDWIKSLVIAQRKFNADVVHGPCEQIYPEKGCHWIVIKKDQSKDKEGNNLESAATGNILISSRLFHPNDLGLKFDESMNFTGGEDTEYFYRAKTHGVSIIWTNTAIVKEKVIKTRLTYRWQFLRELRVTENNIYIQINQRGYLGCIKKNMPKFIRRLIWSIIYFLISPLVFWKPKWFFYLLMSAGKKFAFALGFIRGLLGRKTQMYLSATSQH